MAPFSTLSDRLWGYILPQKPRQQTVATGRSRDVLSHVTGDGKVHKRTGKTSARNRSGRSTQTSGSPSASRDQALQHSQSPDSESRSEDQNKEVPPSKQHGRKSSLHGGFHEQDDYNNDDDDAEARIPQTDINDLGGAMVIHAPPHATIYDPDHLGWTQAEVDLFNRLNDRGAVPLMPTDWQMDFATIPEALFSDDLDEVFIKASEGTNFRAIKALQSLFYLGQRVRERAAAREDPAPLLARAISAYNKWALTDAGLSPADQQAALPLFVVAATRRGETVHDTVLALHEKFRTLARRFLEMKAVHGNAHGKKDAGKIRTTRQPHPSSTPQTSAPSTVPSPASGFYDTMMTDPSLLTPSKGPSPLKSKKSPRISASPRDLHHPSIESDETDNPPSNALPTFYGIVITRTVMGLTTYNPNADEALSPEVTNSSATGDQGIKTEDSSHTPHARSQLRSTGKKPTGGLRNIGVFDWRQKGQDVWHAFAVAIAILQARNDLLEHWSAVHGDLQSRDPRGDGSIAISRDEDPDA